MFNQLLLLLLLLPPWLLLAQQGVLFPALRRVKLIPEDADISTLNYSRCGRTDKGVSAFGQVCMRLRAFRSEAVELGLWLHTA